MLLHLRHNIPTEDHDAKLIALAIPGGVKRTTEGRKPKVSVVYLEGADLDAFRDALKLDKQLSSDLREAIGSAWLHEEFFIVRLDGETIVVSERTRRQFAEVRKHYSAIVAAREQLDEACGGLIRAAQQLEGNS